MTSSSRSASNQLLCELADTILYYHDACGFVAGGDSKNYVITDCHGGTMPARCCYNTRFARADGAPECPIPRRPGLQE